MFLFQIGSLLSEFTEQHESPCPSTSEGDAPYQGPTDSTLLPSTTQSTTSTESTPPNSTPAAIHGQDQLDHIATTLQKMLEEQGRLRLQVGQGLVSAYKQQQSSLQQVMQRLDQIEKSLTLRPEPTSSPIPSESRPALFSPAPTVPKFRNKTLKHPIKFLEELDKYFKKMKTPLHEQLDVVLEALEEEAQYWAGIFQVSWTNFMDFRNDFLQSFWSESEQIQLRRRITNHRWQPGRHTMEAHQSDSRRTTCCRIDETLSTKHSIRLDPIS